MFGWGLNDYEKHVYEQRWVHHVSTFGLPEAEARKAAMQEVKDAIAQSKAEGCYGAGPVGEKVLGRYKNEARFAKVWEAMKAAGVRDEDVVEWWNIPDLERRLMIQDDAVFRMSLFAQFLNQGKDDRQAGRMVWKAMPIYGDPTAPPTFPDDPESTMLPVEMKIRYIRWAEAAQARGEWEAMMKTEAVQFGTLNAYIRHLARQGRF